MQATMPLPRIVELLMPLPHTVTFWVQSNVTELLADLVSCSKERNLKVPRR